MRVLILNKDRTITIKKADSNKKDFEYKKSLYILSPDRIQNYTNHRGTLIGSEIIFFEDNPNGLTNDKEGTDKSEIYLDDIVVINFIQQATDTFGKWDLPKLNLGWIFDNPGKIPMILMIGWVLWILFKEYFMSFLGIG